MHCTVSHDIMFYHYLMAMSEFEISVNGNNEKHFVVFFYITAEGEITDNLNFKYAQIHKDHMLSYFPNFSTHFSTHS